MVDDNVFIFRQKTDGSGCKVTGKSVSQSVSFYDFETNYCNIWNPLTFAEGYFEIIESGTDCKWQPEDPAKHCVRATTHAGTEHDDKDGIDESKT